MATPDSDTDADSENAFPAGLSGSQAKAIALSVAIYSFFSRFAPSTIECHPYTSETMKRSMRRSSGALSLTVDL
jgi:hypothetical protein